MNQNTRKCVLCHMRTTKVQIRLRIRAVWSAPLFSLLRLYNTYTCYIQSLKASVSKQVSLSLTWSQIPKDAFSHDAAQITAFQWRQEEEEKTHCDVYRTFSQTKHTLMCTKHSVRVNTLWCVQNIQSNLCQASTKGINQICLLRQVLA